MIELLASSLRLATPLIFAAMGGLLCERSGIATICLEGAMLVGAWTGASVNFVTGDPWLAMGAAMLSGSLVLLMHAVLSITARADQIVSGVAINILAMGATPLFTKIAFGGTAQTPMIPQLNRFQEWAVPGLSQIPMVGPLLFRHVPLIYLALCLPFVMHFILYRTRWGLRLLACGDGPDALKTAGISPERIRFLALVIGGAIVSLGGVFLSISHSSQFSREMTAGRGFIALTAVIFGKWKPLPTLGACLFFGFTDALQIQFQSSTLYGFEIPVQLIQAIPYLATLFVLVGFIGKSRPPLSIGIK